MSGLKCSCGRQTAGSLRSGERSYDRYFPNDAQLPACDVSNRQVDADEVDDDDLGDVHYWMERLLEPPQPISLEEMVPDERWDDFWDTLDANAKREKLAQLLQGLPKHQRQALMLKDAYGFETFEIVRALGRCSEDVESDLTEAREKVRAGLGAFESSI